MLKHKQALKPVSGQFPLPAKLLKEMKKFLGLAKKARSVLISSTLTSDGDSIGSQIAISYLIRALNKRVRMTIVNESAVPERYRFLEGTDRILTSEDFSAIEKKPSFDLGVVCDGGVERTGDVQRFFEGLKKIVLVDHHAVGSRANYEATLLDLSSSSTCELVFHLFEVARVKIPKAIAEHLFVGIVFDTGFFKHSLTTPRTHYVAAHLMKTGIDFSHICDLAILERSFEAQLLLKSLLQNMESRAKGRIIASHWSLQDLERIGSKDGDQEGMINQLYYTQGAEVIVLFTERKPGDIKISFRSKGLVNVAEFARKMDPHGGGHVRASGCGAKGNLAEVKLRFLAALESELASIPLRS